MIKQILKWRPPLDTVLSIVFAVVMLIIFIKAWRAEWVPKCELRGVFIQQVCKTP